ncbi:MAG TPA: DUF2804 domain-containing protein [Solimonas sp.]|nr:DUF2804 domain-containing protein [Solimonas sp.]
MSEAFLPEAPAALHAGDGRVADYGRYAGRIADLRTAAWDGGNGVFSRRRLQRKGWVYFGAFSDRYMVGYAVADAGLMATAFVYVYDRQTKKLHEQKATRPFGFPADFEPTPDALWQLRSGACHWDARPTEQGWAVRFNGTGLKLEMDFRDNGAGMTAIASSPFRPFHHTYKICGMPVRMSVEIDGQREECTASGTLDFTLGYPPRRTDWNWASLDGVADDGTRIGVNLVAHFMNGQENALWFGNELRPLAQAVFQYDPAQLLQPWRIATADGALQLEFLPEGERREDISIGLLASLFTQPFGRFSGTLKLDGRVRKIEGFGVVEQHRAVW